MFFSKKQSTPIIIGVCGRSCSGKSTIVKAIEEKYPHCLRINQDKFFKIKAKNWERPEALRFDRLIYSVKKLKSGQSTHIPSKGWTEDFDRLVEPTPVIIVEGFLLFVDKELTKLFDKKIYFEVSDLNILYRRTIRDGHINGMHYTKHTVIPESKKYEEKQKKQADIIIDGNKSKEEIIEEFEKKLKL